MSATRVAGHYRSAWERHEVLVIRDASGRWQVVDAASSDIVVVETLTGHDDRLDQALALARDYAAEQQAYQDGRRESDPLPRPSMIDAAREAASGVCTTVGATIAGGPRHGQGSLRDGAPAG